MDLTAPYVPDLESIPAGLDLPAEIRRLKVERRAVLLAHYYQEPEIQDLADFVGDSLQLSQQAARADADVIAFCGVHFMAETAKILNPSKTVVIPDMDAGCSLADRCPADYFAEWLKQYPDHDVVSYINCSAGVKALSTVICTSSNAVRVVESLPKERNLVFAPDRHLGKWVMQQTGRDMTLFPGFCIVHEQFTAKHSLNVPLLADVDKAVATKYDAAGALGVKRAVIVIDEQGIVRHRHDHRLGLDFQSVDELKAVLDTLPAAA